MKSLGNPDLKCNPSVFCETRYFSTPYCCRVTKDICVNDGLALVVGVYSLGCGLIPKAFFYHAPGPVGKTVSFPDLKSGIPVDVEIPAPVNEIKWLDVLII